LAFLVAGVACGTPANSCGGGFFESCITTDPAVKQQALNRPEAKLIYPRSLLLNQAATGVEGVNTATGTQARVTRIFQLPPGATFALVIDYYDQNLTALGWQQSPEPARVESPYTSVINSDSFVRWTRPTSNGGDLFILTSLGPTPAVQYRAQLTVDGIDSQGNDNDSAYVATSFDSPDPRLRTSGSKASPSG
jgi:hypothetical protein